MKKNITLIVALTVLMILLVIAPVFASPAEKVVFTGILTGTPQQQGEDYRKIITNGETIHIINQIGAGTIRLWLGTTTSGTPTYDGTWTATFKVNLNLKTGGEGPAMYKMIWTFLDGTFEGNLLGTMVAPGPNDKGLIDLHGILQGTGRYAEQRIMIEDGYRALAGGPTTYTGTIMTP
jgi:hypothetical protein